MVASSGECSHPRFEFAEVMTPIAGATTTPMQYHYMAVAVRCAVCHTKGQFQGFQPVHPQMPSHVGTLEAGTVLQVQVVFLPAEPSLSRHWHAPAGEEMPSPGDDLPEETEPAEESQP